MEDESVKELLPCPSCGSEEIEIITCNKDVLVGCSKCGVSYDSFDGKDPIKTWNQRAKP